MPETEMPNENTPDCSTRSLDEPAESGRMIEQCPVDESGGVSGPEPTRYGDWEKNGRCIDF
ncbi:MAG: DUF1674 domain-containing protein [Gammaproteobacteria bacterium]